MEAKSTYKAKEKKEKGTVKCNWYLIKQTPLKGGGTVLTCMDYSKHYKHEYFFKFKGKKYRVHSVVRLTNEAKSYLGSATHEVILTEIYYNFRNQLCYKYEFKSIALNVGIINKTTDRPPDKLIEEVVSEASVEYASREMFGTESPFYKTGKKHTKKDWEIPEVLTGWIVLILVFVGASIFKDWYVQLLIRVAAGWIFGLYRQAYINAYTTYTHDEDADMLQKKYEILYGIKANKEDNANE